MKSLYCPECNNYLEGGDGSAIDCPCGWQQSQPRKCHQCGNEADYECDQCGEPVCEDCCAYSSPPSLPIERTICTWCHEGIQERAADERYREYKIQKAADEKRNAKNARRREIYWRPENARKRRIKKQLAREAAFELRQQQLTEAVKTIGTMFKGMF